MANDVLAIESYGYSDLMGAAQHTVGKTFSFSASHVLDRLPRGHKCARLHGHTYEVCVALAGELDEIGFVVDFGELDWIAKLIADVLDHRHLNDVLDVNPTSENIASWLLVRTSAWAMSHQRAGSLHSVSVTVRESPRTYATVTMDLRA